MPRQSGTTCLLRQNRCHVIANAQKDLNLWRPLFLCQEFPSASAESQLSAAVPRSPSTPVDSGSGCSPPREDLQTVPVFKRSRSQDAVVAASASEASTVPQR